MEVYWSRLVGIVRPACDRMGERRDVLKRQKKERVYMRIGLISDIHGNLIALESVLSELKREQVDRMICLGDVAALGPQPHEVIERLRELRCPVVMGNTDDWYLQPLPEGDEELRAIVGWGLGQLTDADLAYLHSFQPVIKKTLEAGQTLLCSHGSPRSYHDVIASTTPVAEIK